MSRHEPEKEHRPAFNLIVNVCHFEHFEMKSVSNLPLGSFLVQKLLDTYQANVLPASPIACDKKFESVSSIWRKQQFLKGYKERISTF